MNNDLISRDALKKALKSNCDLCHDKNTNWCEHCCPLNDFEDLIDNAPTVFDDKAYSDGYTQGTCDCEHAHERPQSEITNEDIQQAIKEGFANGYEMAKEKFSPKKGAWIVTAEDNDGVHRICCPFCSYEKGSNNTDAIIVTFSNFPKFCENCGSDMRKDGAK